MDMQTLPYRLRTARQKRRLIKKDRDKRLIKLSKKQNELYQQRRELPMVPLKYPYESGWKREFTLREDMWRHPKSAFYAELLSKINTVQYHPDQTFKLKKGRKARHGYQEREQKLLELSPYLYHSDRLKLTDEERKLFMRIESLSSTRNHIEVKYVFTEPWRYVLSVMPHIVTEVKLLDAELEKQMGELNRYITHRHLAPRMYRLTRGKRFRWKDEFNDKLKYINKSDNTSRYSPHKAYLQ